MRVLVIESALSGHHRTYLERLTRALLDAGMSVTVALDAARPGDESIDEISIALGKEVTITTVHFDPIGRSLRRFLGNAGRELAYWRLWAHLVRGQLAASVDCVVVPYLDYCLYAIGLLGSPFGSLPWVGVCMRPSFHHPLSGLGGKRTQVDDLKEALFVRVLNGAVSKRVISLDPLLPEYIYSRHSAPSGSLAHAPDPADPPAGPEKSDARLRLSLPRDVDVVLVYGVLDTRKGIDDLIRVLARIPACAQVHALIVGVPDARTAGVLGTGDAMTLVRQGRLHLRLGYASAEMEGLAFASSDVVWANYRNHRSMSGVIVKAAMARRASIVAQHGLAAWYVARFGWGRVVNECAGDAEIGLEILDAIRFARTLPESLGDTVAAAHSWVRMSREIVRSCQESKVRPL
jgi:glycosyltransferase involved in cell wall biosynthesis